MKLLNYLAIAVLLLCAVSAEELVIEEAGQTNVFLNDQRSQVHLVQRDGRTVFAFPAENSGIGLWYSGRIRYLPDTLKSEVIGQGQAVSAEFEVLEPVQVRMTLLDNLRVLRDYNNGADTASHVAAARDLFATAHGMGSSWAEPLRTVSANSVVLTRLQPGYGPYQLRMSGAGVTLVDEQLKFAEGTIKLVAVCPFPKNEELKDADLFAPGYVPTDTERVHASLVALKFLSNKDKMMAGSWRFLTYFGRDTLISLSMLEPILSDEALVNGLNSVLERLSPEGDVAHEEDIGSWAEWRHLEETPPQFSLAPVHDYKMVDDDLLLPVVLHHLKKRGRNHVWNALLESPVRREQLERNADFVLAKMQTKRPILLLPGESVGDWRDSETGLAGGVDPYSVNGALTVPALKGMAALYETLGETEKAKKAKALVPEYRRLAERFWVEVSVEDVRQRLYNFSKSLDSEPYLLSMTSATAENLKKPFVMPVLSFDLDGSANVVSHSDVAFNLFYQDLSESELERILVFLENPFPLGILTPLGPVVANPLLSPDETHHRDLGFGRYHGMVVWSWQSAMLSFGLMNQAEQHPVYRERIEVLLQALSAAEARVGELATSELWAVEPDGKQLKARGYGVAGDQTESNAMQLWSTVYPALEFQRQRFAKP